MNIYSKKRHSYIFVHIIQAIFNGQTFSYDCSIKSNSIYVFLLYGHFKIFKEIYTTYILVQFINFQFAGQWGVNFPDHACKIMRILKHLLISAHWKAHVPVLSKICTLQQYIPTHIHKGTKDFPPHPQNEFFISVIKAQIINANTSLFLFLLCIFSTNLTLLMFYV